MSTERLSSTNVSTTILSAERLLSLPVELRRRPEMGPLIHAVLQREGRLDELDPTVRASARREYLASLARATLLRSRAVEVLDEAERRGLRLLLLKGVLFAETLYASTGARPMTDVDLAVEPEHLSAAVAMLEEMGYRRLYPGRRRFSEGHAHGHDVAMVGRGAHIELHHRAHHELGMDGDLGPWFDRAIEVDALEGRRWAPAWDDHLCYVAVHAATHALSETPIWLFDVALLLERLGSLDNAQREAERRRTGVAFWAATSLAHELLPDAVPAPDSPPGAWLRRGLLTGLLGRRPFAAEPDRIRSLMVRAVLTDSPQSVLAQLLRKAGLRLYELAERRSGSP